MDNWLPLELVFGTLIVTSFTCNGLLALWAATSPRHWFVRGAAVLALLSPLLLIPAYEPWIALTLQALIVVAGADAWRWCASRPHRFAIRFSLRTLLAGPPMVAAIIVIGTRVGTNLAPPTVGSWVTMGPKLGQMGLCSGANDFGGTLMEESISRESGSEHGENTPPEEFRRLIREIGRIPVERTTLYGEHRRFDDPSQDPPSLEPVLEVEPSDRGCMQ